MYNLLRLSLRGQSEEIFFSVLALLHMAAGYNRTNMRVFFALFQSLDSNKCNNSVQILVHV